MKKISRKQAFTIAYIPFLISAASVWMILGAFDTEGNMNALGYIAGSLFWLGLLGGIGSYIYFFRKRYQGPNVLKFFSNKPAMAADVIFIISLAVNILLVKQDYTNRIVALLFIFLLLLSLYSHFLFNGKIFTKILIENKKEREIRKA